MCIAIYQPKGTIVSNKRLAISRIANPDGWGLMCYLDNKLHTSKGIDKDKYIYDDFYTNDFFDFDVVIHFRTASSGQISIDGCHPFFVNDNLAFVEQGNLYEFSDSFPGRKPDGLTDIQRFNNEVLKKLPDNFLNHFRIRKALENYCINNFVKMIFMDNLGKVTIINEQSGIWVDGVWFSNYGIDNYVGYGYSGATYYQDGDIRHKGGLITVQMFEKWRREKWSQCDKCLGYYIKADLVDGVCQGCLYLNKLMEYVK